MFLNGTVIAIVVVLVVVVVVVLIVVVSSPPLHAESARHTAINIINARMNNDLFINYSLR